MKKNLQCQKFTNNSWLCETLEYDLPAEFTRKTLDFTTMSNFVAMIISHFNNIWFVILFRPIIREKNRCALDVPEGKNCTKGGTLIKWS